jgi:hypothetical protein
VLKIAVITPYFKEPLSILRQCHLSVIDQKVNASVTHFLISDGYPAEEIDAWKAKHITLPQSHDDNGNTPRGLGSVEAKKEGFDFITFLDADNWLHQNHLQSLLDKWIESKNPVICSSRTYHQLNGKQIIFEEPDENSFYHVDTSCFFLHKDSFDVIDIWLKMPKALGPLCDRVFMSAIKFKKYPISFTKKRTLAFRSQYLFHYLLSKTEVVENLKPLNCLNLALEYLQSEKGVIDCKKKMGFDPLSYMKTYNILFLSEDHPNLTSMTHIFAKSLSFRRFNAYRAYVNPNDDNFTQAEVFAKNVGLFEFDPKENNELVTAYLKDKSPQMDFIFHITTKTPKLNTIKWPGRPKMIYWEFSDLINIQSEDYDNSLKFEKIALSIRLKIENFLSLTEEELIHIANQCNT